jgi:hypothetical protein
MIQREFIETMKVSVMIKKGFIEIRISGPRFHMIAAKLKGFRQNVPFQKDLGIIVESELAGGEVID